MKIAHEVPLFMLEKSREFNTYDYALVHLFGKIKEYYQFFVDSLKQGREVIVDNSVFELDKAFDAKEFVTWLQTIANDAGTDAGLWYIIPDVLDDCTQTINNVTSFVKKFPNIPGRAIGVAQGDTFYNLLKCYGQVWEHVDKVAVSFNCRAYETWFECTQPSMAVLEQWVRGRQLFLEMLHHSGWLTESKPMHLLGCAVPQEFRYYTTEHPALSHFIDSLDTSNPIVHGMLGIRYSNAGLNQKKSIKIAEMMDTEESKCDMEAVYHNIKMFRGINAL
jgi:hypothetical protein